MLNEKKIGLAIFEHGTFKKLDRGSKEEQQNSGLTFATSGTTEAFIQFGDQRVSFSNVPKVSFLSKLKAFFFNPTKFFRNLKFSKKSLDETQLKAELVGLFKRYLGTL